MKTTVLILSLNIMAFCATAQKGGSCADAIPLTPGSYIVDSMVSGAATFKDFAPHPTKAKWYKFTPSSDGLLTVSSCGGGADTRIFVFSGTCSNFTLFGANDDFCAATAGGETVAASFSKPVKANVSYFIEWDNAWGAENFTFSLSFNTLSARAGQTCQTAIAVNAGSVVVDSLFGYASKGDATRANWYKFTPTKNGRLTVNACGEDVDTRLFIYDACGATEPVASGDDNCLANSFDTTAAAITDLRVTVGKTYFIEWDDSYQNAPFTFNVVFDATTSLNDPVLSKSINITPNPASDVINVNFDFDKMRDMDIRLVNSMGQIILNKKLVAQVRGAEVFNVSSLKNGVYFLQIRDGEVQTNKKVLINH